LGFVDVARVSRACEPPSNQATRHDNAEAGGRSVMRAKRHMIVLSRSLLSLSFSACSIAPAG
jgi:hypothetical protein